MSNWFRTRLDPDDELKAADDLLHKADALLRRHKGSEREPDVEVSLEEEDLPILTDVVSDLDEALPVLTEAVIPPQVQAEAPLQEPPVPPVAEPAPAAPAEAAAPSAQEIALAEQLIDLDTEISREVEAWFANELPQLLSRELDRLADRLRTEALAHLRATLLPALSEHISQRLEELPRTKR